MRKLILVIGCALALSGCKSVYMKASPFYDGPDAEYNVPAEDRVNLWPLMYSRDPALSIVWPLYTQGKDSWYCWPAISWKSDRNIYGLAGLFGCRRTITDGTESWLFPLYYGGRDKFFSLLYAKCGDKWCIPPLLSWKDGDGVHSLFYADTDNGWAIPALLTFYSSNEHRSWLHYLLLGIVKYDNGEYASSAFIPLYGHSRSGFATIPFGWSNDAWWLLPLWIHNNKVDLGLLGLIGITKAKNWWVFPISGRVDGYTWWLTPLVSSYEHQDCCSSFWAWPLVGWRRENKTGDIFAWWLGCLPLWSHDTTPEGYTESFCWRLWHKEVSRGSVHTDCFPFITFDERPDGYRKTSFCWRLYRNEYKPGKGRNLDIFFIPFSSANE